MTVTAISSFMKRITGGESRIWELTVPQPDGRQAFYRVAINPLKEAVFRQAWKEGRTVDLKEFGEIVESYFLPDTKIIHPNA